MHQGVFMTGILNILIALVGVLFFAGRLYEVIYLMESGTNFIIGKGIVTTLLMLCILFLITICCGVIAFAGRDKEENNLKFSVGIWGFIPAPFMVIASILNIIGIFKTGGFLGYDIMMILSAIGFVMLGIMNIKGKSKEKLPVILVMFMPLAMCMNAVILKVQPLANTMFLYYGLSAIVVLLFFLMLFKNAYASSGYCRPMLYISALLNFIISGCAALANLIGGFFSGAIGTADLMLNIALASIGMFSLFVALYITPADDAPVKEYTSAKTAKPAKEKKKAKKLFDYDDEEEEEDYVSEFLPSPSQIHKSTQKAFAQDADTRQIDKISQSTIAALFAQKDEKEHNAVVTNAVEDITAEIAVTQAIEKHNTRQLEPVEEATQVISKVKPAPKAEKSLFKGGAKKETTGKVVYKAPKK